MPGAEGFSELGRTFDRGFDSGGCFQDAGSPDVGAVGSGTGGFGNWFGIGKPPLVLRRTPRFARLLSMGAMWAAVR